MDTITHGIAGALIAKAFFASDPAPDAPPWHARPVTSARTVVIAGTLGSIFPDIDVFFPLFSSDPLAFITLHRNVTHSAVMLPIWAALLALLAAALARGFRWPAPGFLTFFNLFGATVGSHVLLDFITSYGTMLWSPFNYDRAAADWVFIIDLTLTSAVLVPQLAAWAFQREDRSVRRDVVIWATLTALAFAIGPVVRLADVPYSNSAAFGAAGVYAAFLLIPLRRRSGARLGRRKWSQVGAALAAGYLAFAAGMHALALRRLEAFVAEQHIAPSRLAALPMPPSAARWAGLMATPDGVYRVAFNVLGGSAPEIQFFPHAPENRYIAEARRLPGVQTFLWFARFPVFQFAERDGHPVVSVADVRFYGTRRPWEGAQRLEPNVTPRFTYEVVFSPDGWVLFSGPRPPD